MKKVILSLAIIVGTAATASAQTEKGAWLLGGTAGFESQKQGDEDATTIITIAPDAGCFVANDLAIGAMIAFQSVNGGYSSFLGAPFVRYYFAPLSPSAKLFGQGSFGFGSIKPGSGFDSQSFTQWELSAGPAFFLNKSVALETAVYYGQSKVKDAPSTGTFGLKVGFQIHLNPNGDAKKK